MESNVTLVHVVMMRSGILENIKTFANIDDQDRSGTIEAEDHFIHQAMEIYKGISQDELDYCLEEGHFEYGNYDLWIYHNCVENVLL